MTGRKRLAALTGFLLALMLSVCLLSGLLAFFGASAPLMEAMMRRFAPGELPDNDYGPMAEMITAYLSGREAEFQYLLPGVDGGERPAFHPHEQQHMADCLMLFRLCRRVLAVSAISFAGLLALTLALREGKSAARGGAAGFWAVLLALCAVALWAAADFEGVFVLFHRLSFANNLWLLNPQTDLLIRLMPLRFFIAYAALLGAAWLLGLLPALLVCARRGRKKSGEVRS